MSFIDSTAFLVTLIFVGTPFLAGVLGSMLGYWLAQKISQRHKFKKDRK